MKYGYFDDAAREYVITRPDTPAPWANYLGSPEYGAIISNNAGGYSFARSGADGRIIRYIFNGMDVPGRYIYLRDNVTRDYWSASWQPVGKDLDIYHTTCRHGLGYTMMNTDYTDIHTDTAYYVPMGQSYEVWSITVRNDSDIDRNLTVTGFCEFTNHGNYEQDQVNLQYSRFVNRTVFHQNRVVEQLHGNLDALEKDEEVDNKQVTERFFGLAGAPVDSYCGDRDLFLGRYHTYANPVGVENGDLGDENSYNEYSCGALSAVLHLKPGEEKQLVFLLGEHQDAEAEDIIRQYENSGKTVAKELQDLKDLWSRRLSAFHVETPDPAFNSMINIWNAYNCYMTFIWSRAASFVYCGLRNGYGYRDTVQDIQGVIHQSPEMSARQIRFMLTAQVDNGAGLPLVKFTHNPGHEDTPDDASYRQSTGHPAYRADDALWLFPTVYKYITESGNAAFLDLVLPFANKDEGSVYEHLKRAIHFSKTHLGPHGMPAGLYADWNDCLRLGAKGESSFVAFQYYYALGIMKQFAALKQDTAYLKELDQEQGAFGKLLNETCWDEDRFIRGFTEAGETIGERKAPEANLWLNPQSWSVISGLASEEQANQALDQVHDRLNTQYGAKLMDPPYHAHAFDGALAVIYNQGTKENAGIFSQTQGWLILAEAKLGHGNRAYDYWRENAPSVQNENADVRKMEPYCYGQFTEGPDSPHFGRSHVHWLTGTASTMMVGCVEGILGIRPTLTGIEISPSIPSKWDHLIIDKKFRGHQLHITVENPDHKESGVTSIMLNGRAVEGREIPADALQDENEIVVRL